MVGKLLNDGGEAMIAVMRMQEKLHVTYGKGVLTLLPEIVGPARKFQLETDQIIVSGPGTQRLLAGAIVDNEAVLNQLRSNGAHLRPVG